VRGQHDLAGGGAAVVEPPDGRGHGVLGLPAGVLTDRGQVHVGQPRQAAVVVAHHREVRRDTDPGPAEGVQQPEGAVVVEGDHRGGQGPARLQQGLGGPRARGLGVVAADDLEVAAQAVAAHGRAVAAAAVGGDRPPAPVDVGDRPVPEAGQVVDGLADPVGVGRADHVDAVGGDPAADHHHRQLPAQVGQLGRRGDRAEQDQGLAAEVDQGLDGPALVPGAGHRAQHHVVATALGGLVEVGRQLGVEGAAQLHQHPDQVGPPPGEQAGRPVGAVAQLGRRLQHPLTGGRARPGGVAQHHRHRGRGHPDPLGDVLEPRAACTS
jgi:hypothetical protein